MYWERQCLKYSSGPDVVCHQSHVEANQLVVDVFRLPPQWMTLHRLIYGSTLGSGGTAFLHERRTPSGSRRLIVVDVIPFELLGNRSSTGATFHAHVFTIGSVMGSPREVGGSPFDATLLSGVQKSLRVYAGQSDPADATHFTVVAEADDVRQTIDGWLAEDDSVKLELRGR
jgi:hypothetical protein